VAAESSNEFRFVIFLLRASSTALDPRQRPVITSRPSAKRNEPLTSIYPAAGGDFVVDGAILLAGIVAYRVLPLSALPEVDYPTIQV